MKATIFKNGNTIIIEGSPQEMAELIDKLDSQYEITVTHTPIERFHTGTKPFENPTTISQATIDNHEYY